MLLTLASGAANVDVAPSAGGAVVAFRWRGLDVLRPTPGEAVAERNARLCASFPLVPFSNRIADARLRVGDETHALHRNMPGHPNAIHGIGFERSWQVAEAHEDRALLALDYDPSRDPDRGWPFAFRTTQHLAVAERAGVASLQMTLAIENVDTRPFPFGLGWHPYFPRHASSVLAFHADGLWETGPTLLPERHAALPAALAFDPPRAIGDTVLDNVFTGFDGVARLDDPRRGLRVTVEGDSAASFLVVFIPPGRDFLAIEPVTQMTDAFNRHARGERGTGTRVLPPGGSFSCTMRIRAQAHPAPAGPS
jgi:aldose 1-epimerase